MHDGLTLSPENFHVLSLDGGGSMGAYALGALTEVEAILRSTRKKGLVETFDLIYGTSTGAIIGSMIALGEPVEKIWEHYRQLAPAVMKKLSPCAKSKALRKHASEIFGERPFDDFRTMVGIVTTKIKPNEPMIFKSHPEQLRTGVASFIPGFGCTVTDAVVASCAAYPFFKKVRLQVPGYGERVLADGGFLANNPTPLAIIETLQFLGIEKERIRVLSVGTGKFPVRRGFFHQIAYTLVPAARTVFELLQTSTNVMEWLNKVLFANIEAVRINETYTHQMTSFLEADVKRLEEMFALGRQAAQEVDEKLKGLFR